MADKRIYDLTKIASDPGNGVLPIDVPGSTETNGITVDNLTKTMPVATSERNGLFSSQLLIGNIGDIKVINFDTYNGEVPSIVTKGNSGGTSPTANSGDWFVLWQFSNGTKYKVQIAIGFSAHGLYIRNSADQGISWGAWRVY